MPRRVADVVPGGQPPRGAGTRVSDAGRSGQFLPVARRRRLIRATAGLLLVPTPAVIRPLQLSGPWHRFPVEGSAVARDAGVGSGAESGGS
jgi:hypothetical protein